MIKNTILAAFAAILLAACGGSASKAKPAKADPELIRSHMTYLASDELKGREAGTPGYDAAAAYVAAEFEKLGVAPAGDDGTYFQTIEFTKSVRDADAVELRVINAIGSTIPLEENVDYVVSGSSTQSESAIMAAQLVFVGYGLVAPDMGRDDYADLDVSGKVVLMLAGTPDGIQTEERAYYGRKKMSDAFERGATGVITLATPTGERIYSFKRLVGEGRLQTASMSWIGPNGEPNARAPFAVSARMSMEGATKLFGSVGVNYDEIIAASEADGGLVKGFELPFVVNMAQKSTIERVKSANVIGMIEGSDPALKAEYIVLTAHLDHIGETESFAGDRINNGALDNAAGVSTLLEAARLIMAGERPRRSILFVVVTAEEKGLLGAEYFTLNPTVPAEAMVANVNLDMPILTYDFTDVVAFGADRSTIADAVSAAAEEMGMTLSPDPMPDQGLFTRSDHFRFVEIGVPSVFLATGYANGGEAAWGEHFAKNYHRPSDDMSNALNFDAAAKFATLNVGIALRLANADQRPLWNAGDFFARQFNGPMQSE